MIWVDESIDELTGNKLSEKSNNNDWKIGFPTQKINKEDSDEWFTSTKMSRGRVFTY